MLIQEQAIMWITEVIALSRGEKLLLADNPETGWIFDAHPKVIRSMSLPNDLPDQ